jgi:hypothetical protein
VGPLYFSESSIHSLPPWCYIPKVHHRVHNSPPPVPMLSQANPLYTLPTKLVRSIFIPSSNLCLGHTSGLFRSGFPTRTFYTFLSSPLRATCPTHLILLDCWKLSYGCCLPRYDWIILLSTTGWNRESRHHVSGDGAPPYVINLVRDALNDRLPERRTGSCGPTWPDPLDFCGAMLIILCTSRTFRTLSFKGNNWGSKMEPHSRHFASCVDRNWTPMDHLPCNEWSAHRSVLANIFGVAQHDNEEDIK